LLLNTNAQRSKQCEISWKSGISSYRRQRDAESAPAIFEGICSRPTFLRLGSWRCKCYLRTNTRIEVNIVCCIEKGCFAENDERFNEIHSTPLMQSPLYEDFMGPQQHENMKALL
jgi:hypothetical protein